VLAFFRLFAIVFGMNSKHRKTLEAIFAVPTRTNLEWARIEALFVSIGCETVEGRGSRVRFVAGGRIATFHRPHPAKEAKAYQVEDARTFLTAIGVTP
jgi:hypothetical protein